MVDENEVRERLMARRNELTSGMNRYEADALDSGAGEVQDEMDRVITSEAKTASLELNTLEFRQLREVEAAFTRLEEGTYGRCIICGREIEPARLRAIPETPYCREHAESEEAAGGAGL